MGVSKTDVLYRRDNYHKWPWTAILVTCTVSGIIFLYIGFPRSSSSGSNQYMSIGLTVVGAIVLLPIAIVLPVYLVQKLCKACGREIPKCCLCLDPLLARNRSAKKNINFYEHKAKTVRRGGRPSVFVIQVPNKHSSKTKSRSGQSIAMSSNSNRSGKAVDEFVETEFNSQPSRGSGSHKSNGSAKSSTTLRHEASKSKFAPKAAYSNSGYSVDETDGRPPDHRGHRSHRAKGNRRDLDNYGFSPEGGDPSRHPQNMQQNGQPIEVLVEIVDSRAKGSTATTTAESRHANTDSTIPVDANNNTLGGSTTSNRLSVDTDIITEEDILIGNDSDSAVCDVEEYVYGGPDELVDARSDFRTDRHSPHSRIDHQKEKFHFDHTSSVHSSDPDAIDDDLPSDCTIVTYYSKGKITEPHTITERYVANNVSEQINPADNKATHSIHLSRVESDRSLASFFTETGTIMSQDRLEMEKLNSHLEPGDTYSLVSESEYSLATGDM